MSQISTLAVWAPPPASQGLSRATIRQLLDLRNPEKKEDVLKAHLLMAANICDVFALFNHDINDLDFGVKALIGSGCFTLRKFVDEESLLNQTSPVWQTDEAIKARESLIFLKQVLLDKRANLLKERRESHQKTALHPGSRERSPRDRKRLRRSPSSSSTSSHRHQYCVDEVKQIIDGSKFRFVGQEYFPKASLVKTAAKHKVSNKSSAYLSSIPLEDWVPSYIEGGTSSKGQLDTANSLREQTTMGGHQVIEHIIAFWCSHGINGSVHPHSVLKFVLLVNKMCADLDKGPSYALTYFKNLVAHIRKTIADSDAFIPHLDNFLVAIVKEPLIETELAQGGENSLGLRHGRKIFPPLRAGAEPPPPLPTEATHLLAVRDRNRLQGQASRRGNKAQQGIHPHRACVFHDPARNKTCVHGSQCLYLHLDTNEPEGARLHKEASDDFNEARSSRARRPR